MHTYFQGAGISYKDTPLAIREALSLDDAQMRQVLTQAREMDLTQELLIISTCNRTEIFYSSPNDLFDAIYALICVAKGIAVDPTYKAYFKRFTTIDAAVERLFRISLGLESKVVGDIQISNQIKHSYQAAADTGMAGPFIHRLLHTIFFTYKRVVQETSFRDGSASVSYAASDLVERLTEDLPQPKVLALGVGEIGLDVCKNLKDKFPTGTVTVMNRTAEKAQSVAENCGYDFLPLSELPSALKQADVVISSVRAEQPIISKEMLAEMTILRHKHLIDLSVPRSIDPAVEDIHGVLLYNIDQLQQTANEALTKRIAAIPSVEAIMHEQIESFNDWSKEMIVSPTINKLKGALEQIRTEELGRYARQLSEEELKLVETITRNMMQKVIKMPVLQLKAACKRGEAETLIDVLNDLFNLEAQDTVEE